MKNTKRHIHGQILYTLIAVILLICIMVTMANHIFDFAEQNAFEELHLQTKQLKTDIHLQMISDRENLQTMANFAAKLYANGESFDIMLNSFNEIGLIENIGILMPSGDFITKMGSINISGSLSFDDEATKGTYVSGRVPDFTHPQREIIRSCVPVKVQNKTVALLYGVINLDKFEERYKEKAQEINANLYVLEIGNGNYLLDTSRDTLGKITSLASTNFRDGYSYEQLITALENGEGGYSSLDSQVFNDSVYMHYSAIDIADWRIMLTMPRSVVYAGAVATGHYMYYMISLILIIMALYLVFMMATERRIFKINKHVSDIRKILLEQSNQSDNISISLKNICKISMSRSSFFFNTYGDDFAYINPKYQDAQFLDIDRTYFVMQLMRYASQRRKEFGVSVYVITINTGRKLAAEMPEFCEFLKNNKIKTICFAVIVNENNNISILGTIDEKSRYTDYLLKEISVCFSMSVYNYKHLKKTESMALEDSLTGIKNRMAYNQYKADLIQRKAKNVTLIYIDVDELHYYNNTHGHAAGDSMLQFVAETFKNEFGGENTYRMGGDEFLIISENLSQTNIYEAVKRAKAQIEEMKYHVSVGYSCAQTATGLNAALMAAEKSMYAEKAAYYQNKHAQVLSSVSDHTTRTISTGIKGLDQCLTIMAKRFVGVYTVFAGTDSAQPIVEAQYSDILQTKNNSFSDLMKQYIHSYVKADFARDLFAFTNYEFLGTMLKSNEFAETYYEKINGEKIRLSVHRLPGKESDETLWIFEKI